MSKRARVTPEIIQRVKEIKEDYPDTPYWRIAKCTGVSEATVGRILRDEYLIIKGKVVRIKTPSPGQIAMLKQLRKVIKVVAHQAAEICRENERRNSLKEEN